MDTNIHEAKAIKELVRNLGVTHSFGYELVPTRSGSLAPHQFEVPYYEASDYVDENKSKGGDREYNTRQICKAGQGFCSISPTGDVYPCLMMPMKVGNLRENSFDTIWHTSPSPGLSHLRSLTRQDLTDCNRCNLEKYCRKCLGVAFSETGELTRPAPSTCRHSALKSEFFKRKGVIT
jgi:radical SAM protein with 4Fe4S-binding SPASM domain